jgi:hypothetical protein
MTRGAAFAVLGASAAIVAATFVITIAAIAAGVWEPRGNPPPTPTPLIDFGQGLGGQEPEGGQGGFEPQQSRLTYDEFLAGVRDGRFYDVTQDGRTLRVSGEFATYEVPVPADNTHVLDDIERAARESGVDPPAFTKLPGS